MFYPWTASACTFCCPQTARNLSPLPPYLLHHNLGEMLVHTRPEWIDSSPAHDSSTLFATLHWDLQEWVSCCQLKIVFLCIYNFLFFICVCVYI